MRNKIIAAAVFVLAVIATVFIVTGGRDKEKAGTDIMLTDESVPAQQDGSGVTDTAAEGPAVNRDDYYGDTWYTDQTDMNNPDIMISDMQTVKDGMFGGSESFDSTIATKVNSRITSYARAAGIEADRADILGIVCVYAKNLGGKRSEYGIEYNDSGRTRAVLVIYPPNKTHEVFVDVFPPEGPDKLFKKPEPEDDVLPIEGTN